MSKQLLFNDCESQGGSYVFLMAQKPSAVEHKRINSKKELIAFIAEFSVKHGVFSIKATGGRNIMDEDGPVAIFKTTVKVE